MDLEEVWRIREEEVYPQASIPSMIHTAGHSYSRTTLSATSSKVFGNSVSDLS